ncbi:M15 family metallopeptidase [Eisenibacter elegans]|jgi:hypothetical protein|uniref:M15 family metallopeptidase n=1 Tax=Eisenibacter elegans TaxID=997 RepID=UPI00040B256F|nr:M15 family metallopeptidase [Eisenibacter elegans]
MFRQMFWYCLSLCCLCWSGISPTPAPNPLAQKLVQAYPDFLLRVEGNELIWKDGTRMLIDDGRSKSFEQRLANADLKDQLSQTYPKGYPYPTPALNQDPGRIRCEAFFRKMYGASEQAVRQHLVAVRWLPSSINKTLYVTQLNGVAEKLQAVANILDKRPHLHPYLNNPAGTFNWRFVSGTQNLSTHSFGIAIDINVNYSDYWQWAPKGQALVYKNRIPWEIVEVFEQHGFIWGGKWYHYDTMHFEYRPELL